MPYLLDTNVLLRIRYRAAPEYHVIRAALRRLLARGETFCFTSQNLVEFWNVSTRSSSARGGLGLSTAETDRRARLIERLCVFLPDTPAVHQEWRRLVVRHSVVGVQVHDARLVAAMLVHGIPHLLTLDGSGFTRYPGITAVHPESL